MAVDDQHTGKLRMPKSAYEYIHNYTNSCLYVAMVEE